MTKFARRIVQILNGIFALSTKSGHKLLISMTHAKNLSRC